MGASTRRTSTDEANDQDERGSAAAYTGGLQAFGVCALLGAIAFAVTSFVSATDFDPGFHPELAPGVSAFSGAVPAVAPPDSATLASPDAAPSASGAQHCQRTVGGQGSEAASCGAGSGGTEHAVEPAPSRLGELLEYLTSRSTAPA